MKVEISESCGNSPRSLLAADLAVGLRSDDFEKVEQWLADDFIWATPDGKNSISKDGLKAMMAERDKADVSIDRLEIATAFSHGKYVAVSLASHMTDSTTFYVHDLYEFTGAGKTAKLKKLTSYVVS